MGIGRKVLCYVHKFSVRNNNTIFQAFYYRAQVFLGKNVNYYKKMLLNNKIQKEGYNFLTKMQHKLEETFAEILKQINLL